MKVEIKLTDDEARRITYFLRLRYKTKASLPTLAKGAMREVAGDEAKKYLEKLG